MLITDRIKSFFISSAQTKSAQTNTIYDDIVSFFRLKATNNKYKQWVYACIRARSESVAKIDIYLEEKKGGKWSKVNDQEGHELMAPLHKVNDHMTSLYLIDAISSFLDIHGNAYLWLSRLPSGKVGEIWPLYPDQVTIISDTKNFIKGYRYRSVAKDIEFDAADIVHLRTFNPDDFRKGVGIVEAARLAIDTDDLAQQYNKNFFENSAIPATVVSFKERLTKDTIDILRAEWSRRFGGVGNVGGTAFLGGDATVNRLNIGQKDMDYLEQRRFSRDEILAMFRVPKTRLGISDDVNRANAEATDYSFAVNVTDPRMALIVSFINELYIPRSGVKGTYRFGYVSPIPDNRDYVIRERETGLRMGYITINEIRAQDGRPPIEGGDIAYMNGLQIGRVQKQKELPEQVTKSIDNDTRLLLRSLAKDLPITEDSLITSQKERIPELIKSRVSYMREQIPKTQKKVTGTIETFAKSLIKKLKEQKTVKLAKDQIDSFLDDEVNVFYGEQLADINEALRDAFAYGGKQTIAQLNVDASFDLANPRAVEWLKNNGVIHATSVATSYKDEVRQIIVDSVDEGTAIADIADKLLGYFSESTPWKSLMVARTEVINGYGHGSLEGAQQVDMKEKKWLNAGDSEVSDWDIENQAKGWVSLDYSSYEGSFGNVSAPASHPNCRCSLLFRP